MRNQYYIAVCLLFTMSIKTLIVPVIYLDFELTKPSIIAHWGEHRFLPHLHSKGTGYLAKQLQKVALEQAKSAAEKQAFTLKLSFSDFFEGIFTNHMSIKKWVEKIIPTDVYSLRPITMFLGALLHPPSDEGL